MGACDPHRGCSESQINNDIVFRRIYIGMHAQLMYCFLSEWLVRAAAAMARGRLPYIPYRYYKGSTT